MIYLCQKTWQFHWIDALQNRAEMGGNSDTDSEDYLFPPSLWECSDIVARMRETESCGSVHRTGESFRCVRRVFITGNDHFRTS